MNHGGRRRCISTTSLLIQEKVSSANWRILKVVYRWKDSVRASQNLLPKDTSRMLAVAVRDLLGANPRELAERSPRRASSSFMRSSAPRCPSLAELWGRSIGPLNARNSLRSCLILERLRRILISEQVSHGNNCTQWLTMVPLCRHSADIA